MPETFSFLQWLGVRLSIDPFSQELEIEFADEHRINPEAVRRWCEFYAQDIKNKLSFRARRDRQRYHGGPLDGLRHDHNFYGRIGIAVQTATAWPPAKRRRRRSEYRPDQLRDEMSQRAKELGFKCGKSQWTAYRFMDDGRAIFAGNATSQAKAEELLGYKKRARKPTQKFEPPGDWTPESDRDED